MKVKTEAAASAFEVCAQGPACLLCECGGPLRPAGACGPPLLGGSSVLLVEPPTRVPNQWSPGSIPIAPATLEYGLDILCEWLLQMGLSSEEATRRIECLMTCAAFVDCIAARNPISCIVGLLDGSIIGCGKCIGDLIWPPMAFDLPGSPASLAPERVRVCIIQCAGFRPATAEWAAYYQGCQYRLSNCSYATCDSIYACILDGPNQPLPFMLPRARSHSCQQRYTCHQACSGIGPPVQNPGLGCVDVAMQRYQAAIKACGARVPSVPSEELYEPYYHCIERARDTLVAETVTCIERIW